MFRDLRSRWEPCGHLAAHSWLVKHLIDAHEPSLRAVGLLEVGEAEVSVTNDGSSDRVIAFLLASLDLDLAKAVIDELVHQTVFESLRG